MLNCSRHRQSTNLFYGHFPRQPDPRKSELIKKKRLRARYTLLLTVNVIQHLPFRVSQYLRWHKVPIIYSSTDKLLHITHTHADTEMITAAHHIGHAHLLHSCAFPGDSPGGEMTVQPAFHNLTHPCNRLWPAFQISSQSNLHRMWTFKPELLNSCMNFSHLPLCINKIENLSVIAK